MNHCKSLRCVATILFAVCMFAGTMPAWSAEPTNESNILPGIQIGSLYYDLYTENLTASVTFSATGYHIAHVVIPPSVTYQGKTYTVTQVDGFTECQDLLSVVIPNTVKEIAEIAFLKCENLVSVTIPNSVERIGNEAFVWCFSLSSVTMGNGVKDIGSYAFKWCQNLRSITLPPSIETIGNGAFFGCQSLTSVTIPASVQNIYHEAFTACANLREIIVESNNAHYCSKDGVLFSKDMTRLIQYPAGKPDAIYGIPDGVAWITNGAFRGCKHLKSLYIPNSVKLLGEQEGNFSGYSDYIIFSECESLATITYPKGLDLSKAGVPETTKCIAY